MVVPLPANEPPPTEPRDLQALKRLVTPHVEIAVDAKVIRDARGGVNAGALTSFSKVPARSTTYAIDGDGKITRFNGKLTWKGTITIQTRYASGATPRALSCYWRGTTEADLRHRDITLGFHESCHREDYLAYLRSHPLPDPPEIAIGMLVSDYERNLTDFFSRIDAYWADMERDSVTCTDEVGGFSKTEADRTNKCHVHLLP
jgi:hypothetical protein